MLASINILLYTGNNVDLGSNHPLMLGTACGKLHRCSTLGVIEGGDSDILSAQWVITPRTNNITINITQSIIQTSFLNSDYALAHTETLPIQYNFKFFIFLTGMHRTKTTQPSKKELLQFIQQEVGINVTKLEALGNGVVYCKLMDNIHPGVIKNIKLNPKYNWEYLSNLKTLQKAMTALKISK